ncbi:MAG: DUF1501 domain-containing protein [Planctomycetota bacterium]|jgi:hypothetical protein|nr:MAG: DUF1501 domain-containing protein [Planctomycetota bacterium]
MEFTRRRMLSQTGTGLGLIGLHALLGGAGPSAAASELISPLAPRQPQFPAKAKHIIHIYLNGGPSQVDTFDPKPMLAKYHGKPLPQDQKLTTERHTGAAMASPFSFQKYGQCGMEVSEIFSKTAQHVDDMCFIRSMHANTPNHEQSMRLMNCGDERLSRPSLGAWVNYGLGTENANLPGFIAMCPGLPVADVSNWRAAFLPGVFQGTHLDTRKTKVEELIENITNHVVTRRDQRRQLDLLQRINRQHQRARSEEPELEARIQAFELAYRMQMEATDAFDLNQEPQHIQEAYGNTLHGRQLLLARRLIERGVRIVQLYHGDVQPWDSHNDIEKNHRSLANECDGPIAALLTDLKQRGLFEETLVICGGEFGRTPAVELVNGNPGGGRDHNHWGFTVWLAGGGVKGGMVHGATDDFGYRAVKDPVHVHDLHATILHLLGFDHTKLTYRHAGRDFRLTDVHGDVVRDILA